VGPTSTILAVPPERAFQVLEDPRAYREMVVGARRIRRFDPRWPDAGTRLHHSFGIGPLVVRDTTEVLECVPGRRLVLQAHLRGLGRFVVEFDFDAHPEGCRLTVAERAVHGMAAMPLIRGVADAAIHLRNRELGRRYRQIVERREHLVEASGRRR
jgi:uncharacterized protein YndB with AHSA1/START domain